MSDDPDNAAIPFSEVRPHNPRPFKRIFNRTEAADYLGMSLTAFDDMRKKHPFFDADMGDKRQGGSAKWSVQHLDLMGDVVLGWISLEMAEGYWAKYKSVRYEDIRELCLSAADKYRREARAKKAARRQATIDARRAKAHQAAGEPT